MARRSESGRARQIEATRRVWRVKRRRRIGRDARERPQVQDPWGDAERVSGKREVAAEQYVFVGLVLGHRTSRFTNVLSPFTFTYHYYP
jgi:hypothetical protein